LARGYPDWYRRREIPSYTVLFKKDYVEVPPGGSATLLDLQGEGEVDGLSLYVQGTASVLVDQAIRITIDGEEQYHALPVLASPYVMTGVTAPYAKPVGLFYLDIAGGKVGYSFNAPISFGKSIRIEYVNAGGGSTHKIFYSLAVRLRR
jgi:hypothetical protein